MRVKPRRLLRGIVASTIPALPLLLLFLVLVWEVIPRVSDWVSGMQRDDKVVVATAAVVGVTTLAASLLPAILQGRRDRQAHAASATIELIRELVDTLTTIDIARTRFIPINEDRIRLERTMRELQVGSLTAEDHPQLKELSERARLHVDAVLPIVNDLDLGRERLEFLARAMPDVRFWIATTRLVETLNDMVKAIESHDVMSGERSWDTPDMLAAREAYYDRRRELIALAGDSICELRMEQLSQKKRWELWRSGSNAWEDDQEARKQQ